MELSSSSLQRPLYSFNPSTNPLTSIINYNKIVTSVASSVETELSEVPSYFDRLPLEIIYCILEWLDWKDVYNMVIAFKQLQQKEVISRVFFRQAYNEQHGHMLWDVVDHIKFFVPNDLDIISLFKRIWHVLKNVGYEELLIPLAVLWAQMCSDRVKLHSIKATARKMSRSHSVKLRPVKVKSRTVKVRDSALELLYWIWSQYTPLSMDHSELSLERPLTLVPVAKLLCGLSTSMNKLLKCELQRLENRPFNGFRFAVRRGGIRLYPVPYVAYKKDEFLVDVCNPPFEVERQIRCIEEWMITSEGQEMLSMILTGRRPGS